MQLTMRYFTKSMIKFKNWGKFMTGKPLFLGNFLIRVIKCTKNATDRQFLHIINKAFNFQLTIC